MPCKAKSEIWNGIETVTLENDLVSAVILAGKGADLLEFTWRPLGINCLYKSGTPPEIYRALDLSRERLKNHSDRSLGGWMEALPHRGRYGDVELTQDTGGIAATIPWSYVVRADSESCEAVLKAELPLFPLRVEKVYTLREGSGTLAIHETVKNLGDSVMRFTWTQHALFGGDLIDEDTVVRVPSSTVFKAWEHMDDPGREPESYTDSAAKAHLRHGVFDLRRPLPRDIRGNEFVVYDKVEKGEAELYNQSLGLTVRLGWDLNVFPYLRALYQNDERGGIVGLEPGDDLFSGFDHSLRYGTFTSLNPGETIETTLTLCAEQTPAGR